MEENNRRDTRIEDLEKNKTDTIDRVPILEQKHSQDDITNNNFSNFNSDVNHVCKTNEDKEMDIFLVNVNKKSISEDIRRCNKKKKL